MEPPWSCLSLHGSRRLLKPSFLISPLGRRQSFPNMSAEVLAALTSHLRNQQARPAALSNSKSHGSRLIRISFVDSTPINLLASVNYPSGHFPILSAFNFIKGASWLMPPDRAPVSSGPRD